MNVNELTEALKDYIIDYKVIRKSNECIFYKVSTSDKTVFVREPLTEAKYNRLCKECDLISSIISNSSDLSTPILTKHIIGSKVFFIQDFVSGNTLEYYLHNNSLTYDAVFSLTTELKKLYNIDPVNESILNWREYLENSTTMYISNIYLNKSINIDLLKKSAAWVYDLFADYNFNFIPSVVHNDLNAGNIIFSKMNNSIQTTFIDFEHGLIGDPLKDLSKLYWSAVHYDKFRQLFFSCYKENIADFDSELLQGYIVFDILHHFSMYDQLSLIPAWKNYFKEEEKILLKIHQGETII